jgi:hypothetical protein
MLQVIVDYKKSMSTYKQFFIKLKKVMEYVWQTILFFKNFKQ